MFINYSLYLGPATTIPGMLLVCFPLLRNWEPLTRTCTRPSA